MVLGIYYHPRYVDGVFMDFFLEKKNPEIFWKRCCPKKIEP
jgi:hypothetical protein